MNAVRSRRAGISAAEASERPLYAKVLGLQYLRPSSLMSFVFFEGSIALAVLLALAELAQWWIVVVLPLSIAAMVKLNDVIAGAAVASGSSHPGRVRRGRARGRAAVPRTPGSRASTPTTSSTSQSQATAADPSNDDPSTAWANRTTAVLPGRSASARAGSHTPPIPPSGRRAELPPGSPGAPVEPAASGGGPPGEPGGLADWPTSSLPTLANAPTEPLPPLRRPALPPRSVDSSEQLASGGRTESSFGSSVPTGESAYGEWSADPGASASGGPSASMDAATSSSGDSPSASGMSEPADKPVWRGSAAGEPVWPSGATPAGELVWREGPGSAGEPVWREGLDSAGEPVRHRGAGPEGESVWREGPDSAGEPVRHRGAGPEDEPVWRGGADSASEMGSQAGAPEEGSAGDADTSSGEVPDLGASRRPSNVEAVRPISPGVGLSSPEQRARQSAARRYH